jgi:hypothetical protein
LRKHHKLIDQIQPDLDTYEVVGWFNVGMRVFYCY